MLSVARLWPKQVIRRLHSGKSGCEDGTRRIKRLHAPYHLR